MDFWDKDVICSGCSRISASRTLLMICLGERDLLPMLYPLFSFQSSITTGLLFGGQARTSIYKLSRDLEMAPIICGLLLTCISLRWLAHMLRLFSSVQHLFLD